MAYCKIHLISDLFLGFNEFSTTEETIPDVDLVVLNGNLGLVKRGMLYATTLCNKYPNTQFIYNLGQSELYFLGTEKFEGEYKAQILNRKKLDPGWPSNLHLTFEDNIQLNLSNNRKLDIFCAYGFPRITKVKVPWKQTVWAKYHSGKVINPQDLEAKQYYPKGTSNVCHGTITLPVDIDHINYLHDQEWKKVKTWEITNNGAYKILITHINPYNDTRLVDQEINPYLIHLDKTALWLTSNNYCNGVQFLGGKLYANPGRGIDQRNQIIEVNS